jgi:hypothetical protein
MVQIIDGSWHVACIELGRIHDDMDDTGVEHGWTKALIGVRPDTCLPCQEKMIAFTTLCWCNVRVLSKNLHSVIWYVCFLIPIQFLKFIFLCSYTSLLHLLITYIILKLLKQTWHFFRFFLTWNFIGPFFVFKKKIQISTIEWITLDSTDG